MLKSNLNGIYSWDSTSWNVRLEHCWLELQFYEIQADLKPGGEIIFLQSYLL